MKKIKITCVLYYILFGQHRSTSSMFKASNNQTYKWTHETKPTCYNSHPGSYKEKKVRLKIKTQNIHISK